MHLIDNLCYFVFIVCSHALVRQKGNSHKYKNGQTTAHGNKQNFSKRINS